MHLQRTSNAPPPHPKCTSTAPQMHLQCTSTAPPAHPKYTSSAPQMHLPRTTTAPPVHHKCTSSAPQTVRLQRTSNSAPPSTPTSFTYLHPHLQRTPTAPPSTSQHLNCTSRHHNLYKSMFSHKIRSAPLSTSKVHPTTGALRTSQHLCSSRDFDRDWVFPDCNSSLNSPMATNCCTKLEVA